MIERFVYYYAEGPGRPEVPIRITFGLHYLKYLENESDEFVAEKLLSHTIDTAKHEALLQDKLLKN